MKPHKPKLKAKAKKKKKRKARARLKTNAQPSHTAEVDRAFDEASERDDAVRSSHSAPAQTDAASNRGDELDAATVDEADAADDGAIEPVGDLSGHTEAAHEVSASGAPAVAEVPLVDERQRAAAFTVPPELLTADPIVDSQAESPAPDEMVAAARGLTRAPPTLSEQRKRRAAAAAVSPVAVDSAPRTRKGKSRQRNAVSASGVVAAEAKQKLATSGSGRSRKAKAKSKLSKSKVAG